MGCYIVISLKSAFNELAIDAPINARPLAFLIIRIVERIAFVVDWADRCDNFGLD
jgi:hypothetical protein